MSNVTRTLAFCLACLLAGMPIGIAVGAAVYALLSGAAAAVTAIMIMAASAMAANILFEHANSGDDEEVLPCLPIDPTSPPSP